MKRKTIFILSFLGMIFTLSIGYVLWADYNETYISYEKIESETGGDDTYLVTCKDTSQEIRTLKEIESGFVCGDTYRVITVRETEFSKNMYVTDPSKKCTFPAKTVLRLAKRPSPYPPDTIFYKIYIANYVVLPEGCTFRDGYVHRHDVYELLRLDYPSYPWYPSHPSYPSYPSYPSPNY